MTPLLYARFSVPGIPLSVNHYVKHTRGGRHYVTAEAKAWKTDVANCARLAGIGLVVGDNYRVKILIYLGKGRKGDVDNFCKCALDALVDAGVIRTDAAIVDLRVLKYRAAEDMTVFCVEAI